MKKRYRYKIEGIVQGVGFRPFVYQIAHANQLNGYVLNNSLGVEIDIEGNERALEMFDRALHVELPPLARVDLIQKEELEPPAGYKKFEIKQSTLKETKKTLISPDMSICDDCLRELKKKDNFRYNYFFINCTNCGPRYSIIKTVPYDRKNTSMSPFVMCQKCKDEYTNPMDRRYHAQPISCSSCGPKLFLRDMRGEVLAKNLEAISKFAELIKKGHIVAMKGMGGFHLICDASNAKTIEELRRRKTRPTKPFAVMFKSMEEIERSAIVSESEKRAIESLQRPIVLVKKGDNTTIEESVAPSIDRLGVFLPYTPLHVLLLERLDFPIIATSANRSGEPIITDEKELKSSLGEVVDFYLDYNREIVNSSDDSVLQMIGERVLMMRSSRGYTPTSFRFKTDKKRHILAVGAHQKNSIALYMDNQIIQSPYIGDLDTIKSCEFFERTLRVFKRLYDFNPEVIVCDKHPNYFTTQWAKKQNLELHQVQHHYAHILSCMFEHDLSDKVLGVAWDGTGYGDDGTVWGGEFLICNRKSYERVAYFEPFLLLGGDRSIKDIKRVALSMIFDISDGGYEEFGEFVDLFSKSELTLLGQMHSKAINSPKCSSVGRIFDAVAVFSGVCSEVSYDGESGLIIESLYDESIKESYRLYLDGEVIRYKHIFKEMLRDKDPKVIATKFINALVDLFFEISDRYDLDIALGGGVFQNRTILEKITKRAGQKSIYFPNKLPINDGGIAVGQLYNYLI